MTADDYFDCIRYLEYLPLHPVTRLAPRNIGGEVSQTLNNAVQTFQRVLLHQALRHPSGVAHGGTALIKEYDQFYLIPGTRGGNVGVYSLEHETNGASGFSFYQYPDTPPQATSHSFLLSLSEGTDFGIGVDVTDALLGRHMTLSHIRVFDLYDQRSRGTSTPRVFQVTRDVFATDAEFRRSVEVHVSNLVVSATGFLRNPDASAVNHPSDNEFSRHLRPTFIHESLIACKRAFEDPSFNRRISWFETAYAVAFDPVLGIF